MTRYLIATTVGLIAAAGSIAWAMGNSGRAPAGGGTCCDTCTCAACPCCGSDSCTGVCTDCPCCAECCAGDGDKPACAPECCETPQAKNCCAPSEK